VEIHPQSRKLLVYLKVDPESITLEPGFTRDVTKIGHFGTGNLEVVIGTRTDFERAQPLILASYQAS
jgi:predicted transport protein